MLLRCQVISKMPDFDVVGDNLKNVKMTLSTPILTSSQPVVGLDHRRCPKLNLMIIKKIIKEKRKEHFYTKYFLFIFSPVLPSSCDYSNAPD